MRAVPSASRSDLAGGAGARSDLRGEGRMERLLHAPLLNDANPRKRTFAAQSLASSSRIISDSDALR